jgi:hypothetical protein
MLPYSREGTGVLRTVLLAHNRDSGRIPIFSGVANSVRAPPLFWDSHFSLWAASPAYCYGASVWTLARSFSILIIVAIVAAPYSTSFFLAEERGRNDQFPIHSSVDAVWLNTPSYGGTAKGKESQRLLGPRRNQLASRNPTLASFPTLPSSSLPPPLPSKQNN